MKVNMEKRESLMKNAVPRDSKNEKEKGRRESLLPC